VALANMRRTRCSRCHLSFSNPRTTVAIVEVANPTAQMRLRCCASSPEGSGLLRRAVSSGNAPLGFLQCLMSVGIQ
jgi:hypothetical protein